MHGPYQFATPKELVGEIHRRNELIGTLRHALRTLLLHSDPADDEELSDWELDARGREAFALARRAVDTYLHPESA